MRPPAIPADFVPRPRLDALLDAAVSTPVTLVSAGPGFGKTLALAHWARHRQAPGPLAWLSVTSSDDSPQTLLGSLIAAVTASGVLPSGSPLARREPGLNAGVADLEEVLDELDTVAGPPLLLVLDDVHELHDREVLRLLEVLLHRRTAMRVVLSARFDPPLRLQRLSVAGLLAEIRSRQLAFTREEARDLLAAGGLELATPSLESLVERTRGWATGLRLAAMGLDRSDPDRGVAALRGSDRSVAEYLLQEVLDSVPADDRRFLLWTSLVDPVTGDLADVLTGDLDGQARLERLEARNVFLVGLAGGRQWFGWHPLFREMLQHQMIVEHPGVMRELHRRAAAWFRDQGDHVSAIRHLSDAQDWDEFGRLIVERGAPDVVSAQGGAFADALEPAASRSRVDPTPATLLAAALRSFRRLDYPTMMRDVESAAAMIDGSSADTLGFEILVATLRMAHARARMPRDLLGCAGSILALADRVTRDRVPAIERYRAIALVNLGVGLVWSGAGRAARTPLLEGETACKRWDLELARLTATGHLAVTDAIAGRFGEARRRAEAARATSELHGWDPEPQAAGHLVALAWAASEGGCFDEADGVIGTVARVGHPDAACRVAFAVLSVRVALGRNDLPAAHRRFQRLATMPAPEHVVPPMLVGWIAVTAADLELASGRAGSARRRLPREPSDDFVAAWRTVSLARCLLAGGEAGGALELLTAAMPRLSGFRVARVEALLTFAAAADQVRRDTGAAAAVAEAVELAAEHGIRRPFLTGGPSVGPMLQRYVAAKGEHSDFVATVLDRSAAGTARPSAEATLLSSRERAVLAYLPTHLKAADIAADLFVSVNTVKTHMQSIYRKLGVGSRSEAVERARQLGLV